MFKLIGAMFTGLLALLFAAYFLGRAKDQRTSDADSIKKIATQVWTSISGYWSELMNPKIPAENA